MPNIFALKGKHLTAPYLLETLLCKVTRLFQESRKASNDRYLETKAPKQVRWFLKHLSPEASGTFTSIPFKNILTSSVSNSRIDILTKRTGQLLSLCHLTKNPC